MKSNTPVEKFVAGCPKYTLPILRYVRNILKIGSLEGKGIIYHETLDKVPRVILFALFEPVKANRYHAF